MLPLRSFCNLKCLDKIIQLLLQNSNCFLMDVVFPAFFIQCFLQFFFRRIQLCDKLLFCGTVNIVLA